MVDQLDQYEDVSDQLRREVEERREAERAARESERRYRALIDQALEGIWVAELETREIVDVNQAFCEYLGFERDEIVGEKIDTFVDRTDEELAYFQKAIREEGSVGPLEGRWLTADGGTVEVRLTANLIQRPDCDLVCTIGRDVRDKKRLEAQLQMTDRLASIGTLAAGIAHELNNPLTYVLTNLHFLERETERWRETGEAPDLEEWRVVLAQSMGGVERMRTIIDGLRAFYRGDDHPVEGVDLREAFDGILELAMSDLPEGVEVIRHHGDVPQVEADRTALEQAFLNILVNAVQAVDDPEAEAEEHRIEIRTLETDHGDVAVEISDTGVGIPPEDIDRIFDPFFTTKSVDVGTGLGLSMTHNIVESFGGRIRVDSEVGEGTTFRVELLAVGQIEAPSDSAGLSDRRS